MCANKIDESNRQVSNLLKELKIDDNTVVFFHIDKRSVARQRREGRACDAVQGRQRQHHERRPAPKPCYRSLAGQDSGRRVSHEMAVAFDMYPTHRQNRGAKLPPIGRSTEETSAT